MENLNNEKKMCQDVPIGNTKTIGTDNARYRWQFTYPYDKISAKNLCQLCQEFGKEFYFQREIGKETGYEHWQGCISLKQKHRLGEVKNILGSNTVHIEGSKEWFALVNYCRKSDTCINNERYNHNSKFVKTIEKLYRWQSDLLEQLMKEPDDRSILWYYDEKGGIGKSAFVKYMAVKHNATIITSGGKKDIAYAMPDDPKIIIFDFTRDIEDFVSYSAIEELKNGMIFSAKYESRMKVFDSPHIVVFSNFIPDTEKMSKDRWNIFVRKNDTFEFRGNKV